jgi:hypothetical protein
MKKYGNITQQSSTSYSNKHYDTEVGRNSDQELKILIIKMINEIKADINKCLNEFQETKS